MAPPPRTSPSDTGGAGIDGFGAWAFVTETVTLNAGANMVSLAIPEGASVGPNLDRIEITAAGTGPTPDDATPDSSTDADGKLALVALDPTADTTVEPFTIQAEDAGVEDASTGNADKSLTRKVNADNPDAFGFTLIETSPDGTKLYASAIGGGLKR